MINKIHFDLIEKIRKHLQLRCLMSTCSAEEDVLSRLTESSPSMVLKMMMNKRRRHLD